jgi:molybdenum cofactor biosynthesis enzyme MoaA
MESHILCNNGIIKNLLINNNLRIAITNDCNLSCSYCHNEGQSHCDNVHYLSLKYIKTIVKWLLTNNVYVEKVNITGGEPLLHPNFLEIIDEMRKVTNNLHLNTNGILLTDESVDKLIDREVIFNIGIDSVDSELSKLNLDKIPINTKNILNIIKYATSNNAHLLFCTVFTNYNNTNIDNLIDWAKDNGVKAVIIIQLHDFDSRGLNNRSDVENIYKTNHMKISNFLKTKRKYIKKACQYYVYPFQGKLKVFLHQENKSNFEVVFLDDPCLSGACANMYTAIDSYGNLMICPRYHITTPISFQDDYTTVKDKIDIARSKKCDSSKKRFDIRDEYKKQS